MSAVHPIVGGFENGSRSSAQGSRPSTRDLVTGRQQSGRQSGRKPRSPFTGNPVWVALSTAVGVNAVSPETWCLYEVSRARHTQRCRLSETDPTDYEVATSQWSDRDGVARFRAQIEYRRDTTSL